MIPLLVFVVAVGLLYFAVVETAFGMLMRLPHRLEVERETENDRLGVYLDDPIRFFVPARLMRGTLLISAVILLAQPIGTGLVPSLVLLGCGMALYIGVGQVLPAILVRRSPERVLDFFLPSFTAIANVVSPLTSLIIGWIGTAERPAGTARRRQRPPWPSARPRSRIRRAGRSTCCVRWWTSVTRWSAR